MTNWLTPKEFNSEYELVWSVYPHVKRRDGKKIELAKDSSEPSYKEIMEELKTKIKDMIPSGLFIYPFSGSDTLTTFGEHCIMLDTLQDVRKTEFKHIKKTVKKSDNLDFIKADWNKSPFKRDLEYSLIFKKASYDSEEELKYNLKELDSQQLSPRTVLFFDPGYYAPLFLEQLGEELRYKGMINGYKMIGVFLIRPEIREVLQNPNGSVRDTVIVYSRIDNGKD